MKEMAINKEARSVLTRLSITLIDYDKIQDSFSCLGNCSILYWNFRTAIREYAGVPAAFFRGYHRVLRNTVW
jgi:hypothetical protein